LIDDPRNRLVFHFLRLVKELQPRYFVMENVPGMGRGGHASILDALIDEFGDAGYFVVQPHRVLDAAEYGVPQMRKRLFILGAREQQSSLTYPGAIVSPVPKRPAEPLDQSNVDLPLGPTVQDAIGDIPDLDRFPELRHSDAVVLNDAQRELMEGVASSYVRRLRGIDRDPTDFSYPRVWDRALLSGSMRTDHTKLSTDRFRATSCGETEPISRFYKLHPDGLCNTIRAGSGSERGAFTSPRPIHPTLPRVLSVREAARLHSFPDWFRFHETKWHGFRQIGNAVAPLVARAVGQAILEAASSASATKPNGEVKQGDLQLLRMTMTQAAAHYGAEKAAIPAPRTRGATRASRSRPRQSRGDDAEMVAA
jgi:DNA (cytosine-5)-methyltransferase 1